MSVTLDGYHGAQNVGLLMALDRGYFDAQGLDVTLYSPASPSRPIPYVAGGDVDLSIAQQPQLVLAREKGASVTAIGSLISRPTAAMVWLEGSAVRDLSDLEGKTIGFPGVPFQRDFLEWLLAKAGLKTSDVTIKNVDYGLVPALVSGRVDAIFGGSPNIVGVRLEARGLKPVITPVEEFGLPAYDELVVVARRDRVADDPELFRQFMTAVAKGTAAATENPEAALQVVELSAEAEPYLKPEEAEAQLEATLPLLSGDGYMDPDKARRLADWMKREGMIEAALPPQAFLTNAYR